MAGISSIRKACRITDDVFSAICSNFPDFRTEQDIVKFIKKGIKDAGIGARPAFDPIVASGWHASRPHHRPTKQKLMQGFCVIDFGARVHGWCSDMTRTVYIGEPSKRERQLYSLVLKIQQNSIRKIRPGKKYSVIDISARKMLKGRKKYFIHALGHGVGRKIHQLPRISQKSADTASVNEVVTIEPGIYVKKKFGIRIEDTVIVKKRGPEVLTKSTKKLLCFKNQT